MSVWVIVVAGGSGSRFGGDNGPKQFQILNGRSIIDWSLDTASSISDGSVLVLPAVEGIDNPLVSSYSATKIVQGGATRSESVRAGLQAVPRDVEIIVIHDAARPLASRELFVSVIDAINRGADAAIPGIPVADTLKRTKNARVVETVDRSELVAVQTPQAFKAEALRKAHADDSEASDDAGLIEAIGGDVVVVAGEIRNFKITVSEDLLLAKAWVNHGL